MNRDLIQGVVKMEIDQYIHQNFIKLMEEGIYMYIIVTHKMIHCRLKITTVYTKFNLENNAISFLFV